MGFLGDPLVVVDLGWSNSGSEGGSLIVVVVGAPGRPTRSQG